MNMSRSDFAALEKRLQHHAKKDIAEKSALKQQREADFRDRLAVYALDNGGSLPTMRRHDFSVGLRLRKQAESIKQPTGIE